MCVLTESCPTLSDPIDCSHPGSSVHGILQTGILEWAGVSYSRGSFWPRDQTCVSYASCTGRRVGSLPLAPPACCACVLSHSSCQLSAALWTQTSRCLFVHGFLQARILEWIAMPFSKGSSRPGNQTCDFWVSCVAGRFFTHWVTWEAPGVIQMKGTAFQGRLFWLECVGSLRHLENKQHGLDPQLWNTGQHSRTYTEIIISECIQEDPL